MRSVAQHVRALLKALHFTDGNSDALRGLSDSEWQDLLTHWAYVRLMLPLRHFCSDALPLWVQEKIDEDIAENTIRFQRVQRNYREIADALQNASVEHVVLKGFAQWPAYMQGPRLRTQSDIDFYCSPESIYRARDILLDLGYEAETAQEHRLNDHLPSMKLPTNWNWRGRHFDQEMPIGIDLHFRFWNPDLMRLNPTGLDQFWLRRIEKPTGDFRFSALDPTDSLAYSTLHLLRNLLLGGLNPHHVYEFAWFLHTTADDDIFWSRWRNLHDDSLRSLQAVGFKLAQNWFHCRMPEAAEEDIRSLPAATQQWFVKYGDSPLADVVTPNKDALWLQLSLVNSPADKRAVLRQRLMPMPTPSTETLAGWSWPVYKKAVRYAASRVGHHLRLLPGTLWQGVRWWWSSKELGRPFWMFYAASFFFDFGMFIFFLLFNLYLLDCGYDEKFIGHVTSVSAVGSLLATIPAGLAARRFGLKKTLLACFGFLPVMLISRVLFVRELPQMAFALLAGGFSTIYAVCISPTLAQLTTRQNRAFAFSVVFSFGIGDGMIGSLIGGRLPQWLSRIEPNAGPAHIKGLALIIASGIVALALWPVSRLKFSDEPPELEKKSYRLNPFLLRFLPALAVWSLVTGGFGPFANIYFSQHLRIPIERIGTIFSASQFSQVVAILLAPFIFKKFGLVVGIVYTQIATALALFGLAASQSAGAAGLIYVGFMAVLFMNEPGMYSLLMNEVAPAERSSASAWNFLVIAAAQAIAAFAAGHAYAYFGYPAMFTALAGIALLAAFLFQVLLPKSANAEISPEKLAQQRFAEQRQ